MSFNEPAPTKDHADCRCWLCSTFSIFNKEGREFLVRTLVRGERYGRNGCLVWKDEVGVEFYDATNYDRTFEPFGQFTGGRYYLSTLRERQPDTGLALDGGIPVWTIDADAMRRVMEHPMLAAL